MSQPSSSVQHVRSNPSQQFSHIANFRGASTSIASMVNTASASMLDVWFAAESLGVYCLPETKLSDFHVLEGQIGNGWTVNLPLSVQIEREDDGTYIASDEKFNVYGEGRSRAEAIADYAKCLIEFAELVESRAENHPPTAQLLNRLQQVVRKSPLP